MVRVIVRRIVANLPADVGGLVQEFGEKCDGLALAQWGQRFHRARQVVLVHMLTEESA
jgi:hypothetical protein